MKNKKIAVLHAQIPFSYGGAELMVKSLVEELKKRKFDAELISVPFRWYPENGLYDNMLMWKMLDLTETNGEKIDLVIPTKFPTYGIQHPNKVLWLMHQHRAAYDLYDNKAHFGMGTIENGDKMRQRVKAFDNQTIPQCEKIFSISQNVAERLKKYNGIEANALYHPPSMVGRYYCDKFEPYILSVGRLDPLKRIDLLIKSLPYSDVRMCVRIVGKGPEQDNLKKLAADLNVEDRVKFLGFVSDEELLELYANAQAIYFAPVDEDYGYVTLEAFLSRKPIITCTDSGGVLEFVENEVNGWVCSPDETMLGNVVNGICMKQKVCQEFGQNGYERVKNISWNQVIDSLTYGI